MNRQNPAARGKLAAVVILLVSIGLILRLPRFIPAPVRMGLIIALAIGFIVIFLLGPRKRIKPAKSRPKALKIKKR